jgi:hypothetical protein
MQHKRGDIDVSRRPDSRRVRRAWRFLTCQLAVALLLAPAAAAAQEGPGAAARPAGKLAPEPPVTVKKEGEYSGVVPGKNTLRGKKRRNLLTWIGFQRRDDGGARLFVQLTSEAPYTQEVRDGALYIKVEGVRYRNRNARRRLDMRFFDTPIGQVTSKHVARRRARKDKPEQTAGIEIRVQFKSAADAQQGTASMAAAEDGFHYLTLDFQPAAGAPAGAGSISASDPE